MYILHFPAFHFLFFPFAYFLFYISCILFFLALRERGVTHLVMLKVTKTGWMIFTLALCGLAITKMYIGGLFLHARSIQEFD